MKQVILLITILAVSIHCGKIFAEDLSQNPSTTAELNVSAAISSKEAVMFGGLRWACWPNANTLFLSLEIPMSTTYSHVISLGGFPKYQLPDNYDRYLVLEYTLQKYFQERKVNELNPYGGVGVGYYWKTEKNAVLFDMFPHNGPYLSSTIGIAYRILRSISIININITIFLEAEYWIASDDSNILYRIGFE